MEQKRPLTLFDLTCLGVNSVIGSSIFLFPALLARHLGPASILSFGLVGALLTVVALCYAEAATYFDRAGGSTLYAGAAFGPRVGFGIGWAGWMSYVLGWAAVADGIAGYLGWFHPVLASAWFVKSVAASTILTLGTLNYRGVKLGALASNLFTAVKLLALALFVLAGLPKLRFANLTPFAPHGWSGLGPACFLAYFSFQGFEAIPVPSGEVDRPQRNVPVAVCVSMALAAFLYMLVQLVAVGTFPGLAGSERPLADAAMGLIGPAGGGLIALAAAISMTGYSSGAALVGPRYLSALAEQDHLPPALARPHPRFGTPYLSVLVTTTLTLVSALALDFNKLVDFSNVVICVEYLATCAALPVLRRRLAPQGSFRVPGGRLFPAAGIAATLWLGSQSGRSELFWSAAMLALGFALRWAGSPKRLSAAPAPDGQQPAPRTPASARA